MQLVERSHELRSLSEAISNAARGKGGVVVVEGPVGSGKTVLLEHFTTSARAREAVVLEATASPFERGLPLELINRLFEGSPLTRDDQERTVRDLGEEIRSLPQGAPSAAGGDVPSPAQLRYLWSILLEMSAQSPVVIAVDDVQHADTASLHCLLYIARRLESTGILLVLGEEQSWLQFDELRAELLYLPHCRRLRLPLLSEEGVQRLLSDRLGEEPGDRLTAECRAVTGGNAALVWALAEDSVPRHRAPAIGPQGRPELRLTAGDAFRWTLIACVHRNAKPVQRVVDGLAVLDTRATRRRLSQLLDLDPVTVGRALHQLTQMGLLRGNQFAHPAARATLLDSLSAGVRTELHRKAAELLHGDGCDVAVIIEHLLATGGVGDPWVLPFLEQATENALGGHELALAVECLKMAARACTDEEDRARILCKLALVEWRYDPEAAARHLPELVNARSRGNLPGRHTAELLRSLLWHGRFETVNDILNGFREQSDSLGVEMTAALRLTCLRLRHSYPGVLGRPPAFRADNEQILPPEEQAASALVAALGTGGTPGDARLAYHAERMLATAVRSDISMGTVQSSLFVLVYSDRVERARVWCDRFLTEGAQELAPTWQALLAACRAEIALRQGDFPAAELSARSALALMRPQAWGAGVSAPLSSLISALTHMGRPDEAETFLTERLPEGTFQTRFGAPYLQARGYHHLAGGRPRDALRDFLACGELMRSWEMDLPALVPWRTDAAEAHLRLGEPAEARRLGKEQLTLVGTEGSRARGMALRVLAATGDSADRRALLEEAAHVLRACGDTFQLARALSDLSDAQHDIGDCESARGSARGAEAAATASEARPLLSRLREKQDGRSDQMSLVTCDTAPDRLSGAEARVAGLAAEGHTNAEIAQRLRITVSTVEQHLTSVYRKLRVKGRAELTNVFSPSSRQSA